VVPFFWAPPALSTHPPFAVFGEKHLFSSKFGLRHFLRNLLGWPGPQICYSPPSRAIDNSVLPSSLAFLGFCFEFRLLPTDFVISVCLLPLAQKVLQLFTPTSSVFWPAPLLLTRWQFHFFQGSLHSPPLPPKNINFPFRVDPLPRRWGLFGSKKPSDLFSTFFSLLIPR